MVYAASNSRDMAGLAARAQLGVARTGGISKSLNNGGGSGLDWGTKYLSIPRPNRQVGAGIRSCSNDNPIIALSRGFWSVLYSPRSPSPSFNIWKTQISQRCRSRRGLRQVSLALRACSTNDWLCSFFCDLQPLDARFHIMRFARLFPGQD